MVKEEVGERVSGGGKRKTQREEEVYFVLTRQAERNDKNKEQMVAWIEGDEKLVNFHAVLFLNSNAPL